MLLKRIRTCYRCPYIWRSSKKDFTDLKAEVDKLDINRLVNVPTSSNKLERKVDDLDVDKLKAVPIDLNN